MTDWWVRVRWALYPRAKSLFADLASANAPWVLGRAACMGTDVFRLLNTGQTLVNVQKGRVDYLVDVVSHDRLRARASSVAKFMERRDILPLIAQQQSRRWMKARAPQAVFMDSFSELTDQLFEHRVKGWRFCCNYSDLSHGPEFDRTFEAKGFLPTEQLHERYRQFFHLVVQRWGQIPIIFLHFPVKLDRRALFRDRYQSIIDAVRRVESEFNNVYSIAVDEEIVDWPVARGKGVEEFPYHYNTKTYETIAMKVRATRVFA